MLHSARKKFLAPQIFRSDRHSSAILLLSALLGLVLANGPLSGFLLGVKETHIPVPALGLDYSIGDWIADLLLAGFFFVVAAELKYELTKGQLNSVRKALVPTIAAAGGVITPAMLYLMLNGGEAVQGWPVPTATDIAFALGVLAVFGRNLPARLRVFLLALAVLDDLIGILFIAFLFAADLNPWALAAAAVLVVSCAVVSRFQDRNPLLGGVAIAAISFACWYFVAQSGIHPTLAGVALGLAMVGPRGQTLAHNLIPWTNGLVLPLFAFSAALIPLPHAESIGPVFFALALALPVGKGIGITLGGLAGAWLARKHSSDPVLGWDLIALAVTGGLGFTVALLMNQLAFHSSQPILDQGALGVLTGSGISLVLGALLIGWRSRVHGQRVDLLRPLAE